MKRFIIILAIIINSLSAYSETTYYYYPIEYFQVMENQQVERHTVGSGNNPASAKPAVIYDYSMTFDGNTLQYEGKDNSGYPTFKGRDKYGTDITIKFSVDWKRMNVTSSYLNLTTTGDVRFRHVTTYIYQRDDSRTKSSTVSGKSSAQSSTTKKSQSTKNKQSAKNKQTSKKKTVKKDESQKVASDPQLLKLIRMPGGMDFGDLTLATPESLRTSLTKYGIPFKEDYDIGRLWFKVNEYRFNLGGEPAKMDLDLSLKELGFTYETKGMTKQAAINLYDKLLKTLRASGVDIKEDSSDSFVRYAKCKFENRKITLNIYDFSGRYNLFLSVDVERQYSKSDYVVSADLFESLGSNVYGIDGLKISDSFEDIKTAVLNRLSPVKITNNSIFTYIDPPRRQILFEIPNSMGFKGLASKSLEINKSPEINAYIIDLSLWEDPDDKRTYSTEEASKALYSQMISLLKQKNPEIKKCSKKLFKKSEISRNLGKIKEIWAIDRGDYTDYYILTEPFSTDFIFLSIVNN